MRQLTLPVVVATAVLSARARAGVPEPVPPPPTGAEVPPDVTQPTHGDEPEDGTLQKRNGERWANWPFSIELNLGLATPVGGAGIVLGVAPLRWASLSCGVGTNVVGVELSCMAHLRTFMSPHRALAIGVGGSGGPHAQNPATRHGLLGPLSEDWLQIAESPSPSSYEWRSAAWLNTEIAFESRSISHCTFRAFLGLASLLNPADKTPDEPIDTNKRSFKTWNFLPYGGVAVGYAF